MLDLSTMKERFEACVAKLKHFGFKGEVLVNKDGVFIVCHDKNSCSLIKNAMKHLSKETGDNSAFYSPQGSQVGFFCCTTHGIAKKTVKAFAKVS